MERRRLLALYKAAVRKIGFRENRKKRGWMPKLAPNDYRSVMRHGAYKSAPAMLKVSPHEELVKVAKDFLRYQKAAAGKQALQVPKILSHGRVKGAQYLMQEERTDEERILRNYPFSTTEEKKEVAQLYWKTVKAFPDFKPEFSSTLEFWVRRLGRAFEAGKGSRAAERGFITEEEKVKAAAYLLSSAGELRVAPFFSHFANTDVTKAGGQCFVWDATIVSRPEMYGAAAWMWGATLHAWRVKPADWMEEVEEWSSAFAEAAPAELREVKRKLHLNLQERMLVTLLVDLPLRRSPFDRLPPSAVTQATKVVRAALFLD